MKKRLVSLMMAVLILTAIVPAAFSVGNAVDFNGHRYERIEEGMTWKQAKKYCEDRGGHLATITSSAEQEAIMQLVKNGEKAQYLTWAARISPRFWRICFMRNFRPLTG